MSFLGTAAKKFESIFAFLKSPKGQEILHDGEGVAEAIDPALTPAITLANSWMSKIFTVESITASAGASSGTGTQKAEVVIAAMAPEIAKYFPNTNTAVANAALAAFLDALGEPAAPAATGIPATPAPGAVTK